MIQNQTMPTQHSTGDVNVDMTMAAQATILMNGLLCPSTELLLSESIF